MSPLVRIALEVLEDPSTPAGIKGVAGTALLVAISTGVVVPGAAPMTVWRWLVQSGIGTSVLHLHELSSPEVARDALRILTADPDAADDARDMAMAVLRGENLAVVTDADVMLLAEIVLDEGQTRRFSFIIEGIHELRGLSPDLLRTLRDRFALSARPVVRAVAVDVAALLPRLDSEFVERLLADVSPAVRRAVLEYLERVEIIDRARAAALVRRHLGSEHHRTVIAAGLTALGVLVRSERGEGN